MFQHVSAQPRRAKRLIPYMRCFMKQVRELEKTLSPAQIHATSKREMNDWNRRQHELSMAHEVAGVSGQRVGRMAAWAGMQKKLSRDHGMLVKQSQKEALSPLECFRPFCASSLILF